MSPYIYFLVLYRIVLVSGEQTRQQTTNKNALPQQTAVIVIFALPCVKARGGSGCCQVVYSGGVPGTLFAHIDQLAVAAARGSEVAPAEAGPRLEGFWVVNALRKIQRRSAVAAGLCKEVKKPISLLSHKMILFGDANE